MGFACRHETFRLSQHVPFSLGQVAYACQTNIHMAILKPNPESKLNQMTPLCN